MCFFVFFPPLYMQQCGFAVFMCFVVVVLSISICSNAFYLLSFSLPQYMQQSIFLFSTVYAAMCFFPLPLYL
jgi:hypothetical protein